MDSRARKNLSNINTELQDVHRIMVQNIEDVLVRGESLSGITLSTYLQSKMWCQILSCELFLSFLEALKDRMII